MKISENLKKYRLEKGLTQKGLAEKLSVTAQAVSRWENGDVEPDLNTIEKLTEIFGVSLNDLLGSEKPSQETALTETAKDDKVACSVCGELYDKADLYESSPKPLCYACHERREWETAELNADTGAVQNNKTKKKSGLKVNWRLFVFGGLGLVLGLLFYFLTPLDSSGYLVFYGISEKWQLALLSVFVFYMFTAFFWQVTTFDTVVNDIVVEWGFEKSISMPGIIFSLDIDSILFMLAYKFIIAPIVSGILFVLWCIAMILVGILVSIFTFPFFLIKEGIFE